MTPQEQKIASLLDLALKLNECRVNGLAYDDPKTQEIVKKFKVELYGNRVLTSAEEEACIFAIRSLVMINSRLNLILDISEGKVIALEEPSSVQAN